jgi:hypothetical protein
MVISLTVMTICALHFNATSKKSDIFYEKGRIIEMSVMEKNAFNKKVQPRNHSSI